MEGGEMTKTSFKCSYCGATERGHDLNFIKICQECIVSGAWKGKKKKVVNKLF
jgi:hypothetical protein